MKRQLGFILITALVIAAAACSGTMKGIDRYSGKRVFFEYEDEKFGSAKIHIVMPGGEKFSGQLLSEPMVGASGKEYPAINEFPGNAEALLFGDRGTEMR